jgi:hypothetical protein
VLAINRELVRLYWEPSEKVREKARSPSRTSGASSLPQVIWSKIESGNSMISEESGSRQADREESHPARTERPV